MKRLRGLVCLAILGAVLSASAQPYGLNSRPAIGPFLNEIMPETAPVIAGNWAAVVAFTNLYFTNALGLTYVPGTNRLCVWEREGRVWTFDHDPAATQKTLVLDLSNQCQGWDDSGLLNLVFHPGFATNRYIFVYYTWVTPGTVVGSPTVRPPHHVVGKYHDRLSRFTLDTNGVAIPGSETVFVDLTGNDTWHNGSGMFFHPANGFLYWTDGDDTEPANRQVITNSLFAGAFRIDVDQRGGSISHPIPRQPNNGVTANYFVPNDNPFVGQSNVLEEFFCLGLRSPHRMTHDPVTDRIFIGDVGQSAREEVSIIEPGESALNFQWNFVEGFLGTMPPSYIGISKPPVLDYPHTDGHAVIGGHVYRGQEFVDELGGWYIFGDNVMRTVWALDESTTPATKVPLCTLPKGSGPNSGADYTGLSSFGLDANDELYMCQMSSIGGQIYKLAHSGPPPASRPLPQLLSLTGAFTNLATLTPSPGLVPYAVNSPLWSDGAAKTRWLALPTNTFVNFAATGEWTFPNGAVFVKHFALPTNDTDPSQLRRLETRLLVRDTNGGVYGATYKWRADYSDADLVISGTNENILITTATGTRTQQWFYPGRQDCLNCHRAAAGGVLGVKTRQQNGDFTYPSTAITDNQLRTWNHIGMFSSALNETNIPGYAQLVAVTNSTATLEHRVRSYLDANCSHCHRPGGGVNALFDARFDIPLASQGIVNGTVLNSLGITGARVVLPANTNKSVLLLRDNSLADIQMPPLAKNVIDSDAMSVIVDWISSLPPIQLSAAPGTRFVLPANAVAYTISVESTIASTSLVSLAISGLPANTVAGFSPGTVAPPGNSTLSITTSTNTALGNYLLTITGTTATATNTTTATLIVSTNMQVEPGALVAHLTFDDGTASDLSGRDNHGILLNGASVVFDGERGNVVSLDGANDFVDLGANASLDLSDNGQATISAWVKMGASKSHNSIVTKGEWSDAYSLLIKGDSTPADRLWTGNNTSVLSSEAIGAGQWTHVAVVINGDLTTFYVNGQISGPTNQDRGNPIDNNPLDHTEIGREDRSDDGTLGRWYFNGRLDDVRIYELALTQTDIQNIMIIPGNNAPSFAANPLTKPAVIAGQLYAQSIAGDATDPNPGDTLTFSKMSGPAWLNISGTGSLSGTPLSADMGTNTFVVRVTDAGSFFDETTLNITVTPAPPIILVMSRQGTDLQLSWSGGVPPYQVQFKTNLLDTIWQNLGGPIGASPLIVTPSNQTRFYRLQGM